MSAFNVNNTNDYMNSFWGGSNSNSQSGGIFGTTNFLGDYYSIKNGTYYKVAKKYYASSDSVSNGKSDSDSKVEDKKAALAKSAAEAAVGSLNKLMSDRLYDKVETTDGDGNMDYDKKSILSNLKSFVEDYNELVESTGDLDDNGTLKNGVRLINQTKVYEGALNSIGISIKSDNTLEIDEEAFNKANMTDVKSLFTGSVSFAKNIQNKIVRIFSSASSALDGSDSIYSSQAKQNMSIGNMFDGMF